MDSAQTNSELIELNNIFSEIEAPPLPLELTPEFENIFSEFEEPPLPPELILEFENVSPESEEPQLPIEEPVMLPNHLPLTVTNTNDSGEGSLRQAILTANEIAGNNTINFDSSLSGQTITLSSGELRITDDLTIDGDLNNDGMADITIDANQTSRVFSVDDDNFSNRKDVVLEGLVITGGQTTQDGGGIYSYENLTINVSNISDNSADGYGGGIYSDYGDLTIISSTVNGNSADDDGGGIYSDYGNLTVTSSTVSDNSADDDGGGIYTNTDLNNKTATLSNVTLSNNTAAYNGGGLFNFDGRTIITSSTISNNAAAVERGSGIASYGDNITLTEVRSSIISNNSNDDDIALVEDDDVNSFVSNGNNLIGGGNAIDNFNQPTDLINTDAQLGPLQNNGGHTKTHALLPGSLAIDAGAFHAGLTTDQRGPGFARTVGQTDIGAFELQNAPTNSAPVLENSVTDILSPINKPLSFTLPPDTFSDADGDELTYSATRKDGSSLPGWLSFDETTQTFNSAVNRIRNIEVIVTATDPSGETASDTFRLTIANSLIGTAGRDNITGTSGADIIKGLQSVDILSGGGSHDLIEGGGDRDTIYGGNGNDRLFGGSQLEDVQRDGSDVIYGEGGDDVLVGGDGKDKLYGGDGHDLLIGEYLSGKDGRNNNDELYGGKGRDTLIGGQGVDTLDGGSGDDILYGGKGSDRMTGGTGRDIFVYKDISEGSDLIRDFNTNQDKLDLSAILSTGAYSSENAFDDYFEFRQNGSTTEFWFASTGDEQNGFFRRYANMTNVVATEITADNIIM